MGLRQRLLLSAYHYCRDKQLSQDVVQDVFEKLLAMEPEKREALFGPDPAHMEAYLLVAVRNKCLDLKKNRENREKILSSVRHLFSTETRNHSLERFMEASLRDIMHHLQPREQEIIGLHLDGYKNEEIAERLGVTYHTVKNNIYEAKKKIKGLWDLFMT